MLKYLHIKNLALMDEIAIDLDPGFLTVTGETGAGKSILLGALKLLSGARANKSIIRPGSSSCEVEAGFHFEDSGQLNHHLDEIGLPTCEEGQLILQRSICTDKISKICVNGKMTTLANLQNLGEHWIDFHGPGEPQKLLKESWQLRLLDLYAQSGGILHEYQEVFKKWRKQLSRVAELRTQNKLDPDEIAFIQKQIERIDSLQLDSEGITGLENDYNRLSRAQELAGLANSLNEGLTGSNGIQESVCALLNDARSLAGIDSSALPLADRVESVVLEIEDLAEEFNAIALACDFDEANAAELESRMEIWMELKRKYGPNLESILQKREALSQKIASQEDVEGSILKLESEARCLENELTQIAETLRERRKKAAKQLGKKTEAALKKLGFKKARISIEILREDELREHGNSKAQILFTANPGQDPLPLNQIASSGEMARVMLAIKSILAQVDKTPVLVFDEIDANVGGEIAHNVAHQLADIGKDHQVICVTHLPQVAAKGSSQFLVQKKQDATVTTVSIEPIHQDLKARRSELARMLGDRNSDIALKHAAELLQM